MRHDDLTLMEGFAVGEAARRQGLGRPTPPRLIPFAALNTATGPAKSGRYQARNGQCSYLGKITITTGAKCFYSIWPNLQEHLGVSMGSRRSAAAPRKGLFVRRRRPGRHVRKNEKSLFPWHSVSVNASVGIQLRSPLPAITLYLRWSLSFQGK